jgi:hypothetical protein
MYHLLLTTVESTDKLYSTRKLRTSTVAQRHLNFLRGFVDLRNK